MQFEWDVHCECGRMKSATLLNRTSRVQKSSQTSWFVSEFRSHSKNKNKTRNFVRLKMKRPIPKILGPCCNEQRHQEPSVLPGKQLAAVLFFFVLFFSLFSLSLFRHLYTLHLLFSTQTTDPHNKPIEGHQSEMKG